MKRFFRVTCFGFILSGGIMFPGTFALADTSITNNITTDTTWSTGGGVYIIENAISIDSGVTLTVDPGVVVKFRSAGVSLTVNGTLDAESTATSSIYFTSINDDTAGGTTPGSNSNPQPGDWTFILIGSTGTATFKYTEIRYGGTSYNTNIYNNGGTITMSYSTSTEAVYDGLYNASGNTTIATSTFSNNGQHGVRGAGSGTFSVAGSNFYDNSTSAASFDFGSGLTLSNSGNTASGTGERGFTVTGTLGSDQTWQADGVPYIVSSTLTIPVGKTLTINPNAVVKFENSSSQISVSGILDAEGTANSNIYFTSIADDVLNDTNGTTTPATAGDWTFILVNSGGVATFNYADIRYGGTTYGANLYNNGGTITMLYSTSTQAVYDGLYNASGNTTIATSTFSNNGQHGVKGLGSGTFTLTGSNFYDNSTSAASFDFGSGLVLQNSGNTASGTGKRGFIVTGSLGADQVWQADTVPYIVSSTLTVPAGKTLTINPNAVVKFENSSAQISISGILDAEGTAASSIYFTSIADDVLNDTNGTTTPAQAGDWTFILVNSGGITTFKYADVRYGGTTYGANLYNNGGTITMSYSTSTEAVYDGLYSASGNVDIASSTFSGNGSYGVHGIGSGTTTIQNSHFNDNSIAAASFDLGSGLILSNHGNTASGSGLRGFKVTGSLGTQTWNADGVPYIVSSTLTIPAGQTLTINPNAILKFENSSAQISVSGVLDAEGNSLYPAVFTSIADDVLNDTNGTTTPAVAGDWTFILVNSGGTTTLNYTIVRYGGATYNANFYNNGGVLNIYKSSVASSTGYGIYHSSGTTDVSQSIFSGNGTYGVYNASTATTTADRNYWGDISGPYNATYNASGTGDPVSNYVSFDPWHGQLNYLLNWNSVDWNLLHTGYEIRWASSTQYTTAWNAAVDTWNNLGGVLIAANDIWHTADLSVWDTSDYPDADWGGQYVYTYGQSGIETLYLNTFKMDTIPDALRQTVITHELGHALGLQHSYLGNIMFSEGTWQTNLGQQDTTDYTYCWIDNNCTPES